MFRILIISVFFLLSGCGGGDNITSDPELFDPPPDSYIEPSDLLLVEATQRGFTELISILDTSLSDFRLNPQPDYFEVRAYSPNSSESEDASDYEVYYEFDAAIKTKFAEPALLALQEVNSEYGYTVGCYPIICHVYIAALYDETATIVDNQLDLLNFLGEIDRPAELHFIINHLETAQYYRKVESGYEVLTSWFDCNGRNGVNLQYVDEFGNVTLLEELLNQSVNMVC
ncbi:hypothetical protein [Planctobacterium marinum]|uniref:Lipoprotein n=1 Tax=Planctobacterium marinum TaxID=1631968 RepID=A0AA48HHW3_9ALTE|nr:hypothetical protein MACH26_11250 [Planctobacterium marinum]